MAMAVRRAPWMFDPRFLRRPFHNDSESHPLVTRFLFSHARYYPPYVIYQFGHGVVNAHRELFYKTSRRLGINAEPFVLKDGSSPRDLLTTAWLRRRKRQATSVYLQPLCSDEEAIASILSRASESSQWSTIAVATEFSYPLKYVEEVLLDQIRLTANAHGVPVNVVS
jgi:hypothetical protein